MKQKKALSKIAMLSMLTMTSLNAHAYNVVDRFKLIDDKLKTEEMLNPLGHDFFLDIGASLNKNAKDFVTDVSDATKFTGTDMEKVTNAQNVLAKYDKSEQTVKIRASFGFPLFSFSAWNLKVQPNVRAFVNGGANVGIRSERLTGQMLLDLINIELPAELTNAIIANFNSYSTVPGNPNNDLLNNTICNSLGDPTAKAICVANQGKYFYPTNDNLPDMLLYAKIDAKVGFFNDYTYGDHFFGNWNLYGLNRTDIFQRVNANMIAKGTKVELPKKKNSETTIQTDFRLGYKNANYHVAASLEEMKISKMKERDPESKELSYGYDPLMRIHANANYRFSALMLNPFLGVHKRKGYGFADGVYAGTDVGAYVWGDRLGLQLRGMVDKQYFTISPRVKLWLMSLEYSLKAPMKSMDGDVKLSALHSIDLRLFF
jgi:hypothetical protein